MLWTRVASSVLLAPLFLLVIYLEAPWFNILAAVIGVFVAFEYMRMTGLIRKSESWTWRAILTVASPPIAIATLELSGLEVSVIVIAALAVIFFISPGEDARKQGLSAQLIIPYAAIPAISLVYLEGVGGATSMFWLVAIVWATDMGAYAIGRTVGGAKLAPSISPNKTWSGAIGGVVSAVLISAALLSIFGMAVTVVLGGLAAVLSMISQMGDLFESGLKRRYKIKDSGNLIPGHGGVMDRFDGLWAAAPVAAAVCVAMGGGIEKW